MRIFNRKDVFRQACARCFAYRARDFFGRKPGTSGFALLGVLFTVAIIVILFLALTSSVFRNPFTDNSRTAMQNPRKHETKEEELIADIQQVIAVGGDIDAPQNQYKQTYLHIAAKYGFARAVTLCLDNKADIEATDYPSHMTPLHRAAFHGHIKVVEQLIERGANIEAREALLEDSVLHSVIHAEAKREDMIAILLTGGADVNAKNKHGETPLFLAVRKGYVDTARFLLDNGADTTVTDILGFTALHQAAYNGQAAIAELLIEYGAELNVRDNDGATPLDIAGGDVAKVLQAHGAKRGSEL